MLKKCVVCGEIVVNGMTDMDEFDCHERCFEKAMNSRFGNGKWRMVDDDGCNGFYEHLDEAANCWVGTGIYYTEFSGNESER